MTELFQSIPFEWVFITWVLSLIVHHHGLKRTSITKTKDDLTSLLSALPDFKWIDDYENTLYLEEIYNNKVNNIRWKLKQLNKLASIELLSDADLNPLHNFNIESYITRHFDKRKRHISRNTQENETRRYEPQEICNSLIDTLEKHHFNKITSSKLFIFWSIRYSFPLKVIYVALIISLLAIGLIFIAGILHIFNYSLLLRV